MQHSNDIWSLPRNVSSSAGELLPVDYIHLTCVCVPCGWLQHVCVDKCAVSLLTDGIHACAELTQHQNLSILTAVQSIVSHLKHGSCGESARRYVFTLVCRYCFYRRLSVCQSVSLCVCLSVCLFTQKNWKTTQEKSMKLSKNTCYSQPHESE